MPKTKRQKQLAELQRKMPSLTDPHATRRVTALLFRFHERCDNIACRRAKNCVGEDAACFDTLWPALPEIQKDIFREMIKAHAAGARTPEEIKNRAFAAIMRYYKPEEILAAAQQHAPASPPKREPVLPKREPILPRARIL